MKVDKIKHYQSLFIDHVQRQGLREHLYQYEVQYNWQQHWDIESLELYSVYDNALTSSISGRLWGGSQNSAKESMLAMIKSQKEFVRSAFRDLFAHEKDLGLRCDRFLFYCDEAIKGVADKKMVDHRHDRRIMSLYLALESPSEYALFDYEYFHKMMVKLEARNIPTQYELSRYQKSMKAIHTVMSKDEKWTATMKAAVGENYTEGSLLIMQEYMQFVVESA